MQTAQRATVSVETELLTVKEAARELGISIPTAHRWVKSGRLRSFPVGPRATLTTLADVERAKAERAA